MASSLDPDGSAGPTPDTWAIHAERIDTPDASFEVAAVMARVEPGQDLHLVNFANNKLLFALLWSRGHAGRLQVEWYLSGQEVRRFLLEGPA